MLRSMVSAIPKDGYTFGEASARPLNGSEAEKRTKNVEFSDNYQQQKTQYESTNELRRSHTQRDGVPHTARCAKLLRMCRYIRRAWWLGASTPRALIARGCNMQASAASQFTDHIHTLQWLYHVHSVRADTANGS